MTSKPSAWLFDEYKIIEKGLLRNSLFPTFAWGKNKIWGPSDLQVLTELFNEIELSKYTSFLDLGSGDGRVVNLASLFTLAFGYEKNKFLNNIAKRVRNKFNLNSGFFTRDYYKEDFSKYDVIYIYPSRDLIPKLIEKLNNEFQGLLIIYKHHPLKTKHKKIVINKIPIYLYESFTEKL